MSRKYAFLWISKYVSYENTVTNFLRDIYTQLTSRKFWLWINSRPQNSHLPIELLSLSGNPIYSRRRWTGRNAVHIDETIIRHVVLNMTEDKRNYRGKTGV